MQTPDIFLTAAGIILFVVLIILLLRQRIEGKTSFLLFLMVVVMIGYPTIKTITIDDEMVSIEKYADQVDSNPHDTAAANNLSAVLEKPWAIGALQDRPQKLALATNALTKAAAARVVVGQTSAAQLYLNKARVLAPSSAEIQLIQQHLDTVKGGASIQQKEASKTKLQQRFLVRPSMSPTTGFHKK